MLSLSFVPLSSGAKNGICTDYFVYEPRPEITIPLDASGEPRDQFLMPASKKSPASSFDHFSTSPFTSSSAENLFPPMCILREVKRWKSEGARSGEYGGWFKTSHPKESRSCFVALVVKGLPLSCSRQTPFVCMPLFSVSQCLAAIFTSLQISAGAFPFATR